MALLLNTNIDKKVTDHICGFVGRVGGKVDQLIDYRNVEVEDINIVDGGFGEVNTSIIRSIIKAPWQNTKLLLAQEIRYVRYGSSIPRNRKTIIQDMHKANENQLFKERYDCCISSNVLEHSFNPIFLLLNFYFATKRGGYQFHAIPHYAYTFDRYRKPSSLEHLIDDFERNTEKQDDTHLDDYRQSAIIKDGYQRQFHEKYPLIYPFIHQHVFDENNTKELFEFMFEEVVVDIIKDEKFSDNIVFFKNELNNNFMQKYNGKEHVINMAKHND